MYNNNDTEPSTLIGMVSYCRDLVRQNGEVYLEVQYILYCFLLHMINNIIARPTRGSLSSWIGLRQLCLRERCTTSKCA